VLGVFREVVAGKRLTSRLEGESRFNDGAAVVAFSVLLGAGSRSAADRFIHHAAAILGGQRYRSRGGGVIGTVVALLTQRYDLV